MQKQQSLPTPQDSATQHMGVHRLLRIQDVVKITGLSKVTIYKLIAGGFFPKQVRIGLKASAWVAAEVQTWIDARMAERFDAEKEKGVIA